MPELPEVEIMVRQLRAQLRGRVVRRIEICDSKIQLKENFDSCTIKDVRRRAKFIILDLSNQLHLLVHLRMTGWFSFARPARFRFAIHTDDRSAYLEDPRRFGSVELLTANELAGKFQDLGPEPLESGFTLARLKRTKRPIKVALLDQQLIAGVGNIYASEALWRAGISPRRLAHRLKPPEIQRLQRAIKAVLRKGIAYGPQIFEVQAFAVYDRAGEPCRRCGTTVKSLVQAQRSTFFCAKCQK